MGQQRKYESTISAKASYSNIRGKNTEKLVWDLLTEWTLIKGLPSPAYNIRVGSTRRIEFVCELRKKIGVDVTNTETMHIVSDKWTKKDYHDHLGEVWIIVFSDVFTNKDYDDWNNTCPENVRVMSIQEFLRELKYITDKETTAKIEEYCKCSFYSKGRRRNDISETNGLIELQNSIWNDSKIMIGLTKVIDELGRFPTYMELRARKTGGLLSAIDTHGGLTKYQKLLGYEPLYKPDDFWTDDTISNELQRVKNTLGYFPTQKELTRLKRHDLVTAIVEHGGYNKYRNILGEPILRVSKGHWSEEKIINDLKQIIADTNEFPTDVRLIETKRYNLSRAISRNGGINKFRKTLGYEPLYKPDWTNESILAELKTIVSRLNRFPTQTELIATSGSGIIRAISKHGGITKFRDLLGYEPLYKPDGFWTDETILKDLKDILDTTGRFYTQKELSAMGRDDLTNAISTHGGMRKFKALLNIP